MPIPTYPCQHKGCSNLADDLLYSETEEDDPNGTSQHDCCTEHGCAAG